VRAEKIFSANVNQECIQQFTTILLSGGVQLLQYLLCFNCQGGGRILRSPVPELMLSHTLTITYDMSLLGIHYEIVLQEILLT